MCNLKYFLYVFYYALLLQPRTQALHCFYRDQRQLIIQARKGARPSTLARLVFLRVDLAPLRAWH